ncbi:hypothetical protein AAG906_015615 [Vitis piasezkii]
MSWDKDPSLTCRNHGRERNLSTIQQTLTPEVASVLNHSIAEVGCRNHGQTTLLHVAATLLGSPSGLHLLPRQGTSTDAKSNGFKWRSRTLKGSTGFSYGSTSGNPGVLGIPVEDIAATRIQTAFRAFMKSGQNLRHITTKEAFGSKLET